MAAWPRWSATAGTSRPGRVWSCARSRATASSCGRSSESRTRTMMEGYGLAALLLAIGAILLFAELLLPTHGLLGLAGGGAILCAVFAVSRRNPWAGLALLLVLAAATPFVWAAAMKIWPRTPLGRRIVLPPPDAPAADPLVRV